MSHPATKLEQTTAILILLTLLRKQPLKITELNKELEKPPTTIYRAIAVLKELGLLNDRVTEWPIKRIFSLTDHGRRVASKLSEIEGILNEV